MLQLQKNLDISPQIKKTQFVSKEDATKILEGDLGEDFIQFLGYNPLSSSIDVYMNADYANEKDLLKIEKTLQQNPIVKEIIIQKNLIKAINKNVQKLTLILLSFSALLFILAIALINNTIRLTVYSKRFTIQSMKLVGATTSFIKRPFIKNSILQGVLSSLIGIIFLLLAIFSLHNEMPELLLIEDVPMICVIFICILIFGILISSIVTNSSVNKYIKMNENDLYH